MKRTIRITLFLFAAFAALIALCVVASAETTATVAGQTIRPVVRDGQAYLFLPSCADLGAVVINEENEVKLVDVSALPVENGAYRYGELKILRSANVGAMFINAEDASFGRAWVDASPDHSNDACKKTGVTMTLVGADASVVYNGKLTSFKGRGNTTWATSAKKPYQIKLDKKTDLLVSGNGDNKAKTWVLLANALDKTMIKNALAFDLSRYLGLAQTPEYRFVDLYTDGEYRGLYQLSEKCQIGSGRVDVDELEEHNEVGDETAAAQATNSLGLAFQYNPTAVCDRDDISGGYLLEQDGAFWAAENCWFRLYTGSTVVVKSPECCTREQMEFISVRFNEAYHAAQDDFYNGVSVTDLFDVDSLASLYMVNEYTKNCDFTASSTYFFLPEQGSEKYQYKFYAGPAWDFDTSLGNRTEQPWMREPTGLFRNGSRLFAGSVVRSAIRDKAARLDAVGDVLFAAGPASRDGVHSLSYYRALIDDAQRMNFTIWPFDDTVNTFCLRSYDENYDYVFNFLRTRHRDILPAIAAWKTPDYAALQPCMHGEHRDNGSAPTCTSSGGKSGVCAVCGGRFAEAEPLPALGHLDVDGDRLCDRCGKYARSVPAFIEPLMRLIARILRVFRSIRGLG